MVFPALTLCLCGVLPMAMLSWTEYFPLWLPSCTGLCSLSRIQSLKYYDIKCLTVKWSNLHSTSVDLAAFDNWIRSGLVVRSLSCKYTSLFWLVHSLHLSSCQRIDVSLFNYATVVISVIHNLQVDVNGWVRWQVCNSISFQTQQ